MAAPNVRDAPVNGTLLDDSAVARGRLPPAGHGEKGHAFTGRAISRFDRPALGHTRWPVRRATLGAICSVRLFANLCWEEQSRAKNIMGPIRD